MYPLSEVYLDYVIILQNNVWSLFTDSGMIHIYNKLFIQQQFVITVGLYSYCDLSCF